jgi:hypothetical protein
MPLLACPECQELVSDRARACPKCELPLSVICTDCGSDIRYPATQCPQCGCPLKAVVQDTRAKAVSELASTMFKAQKLRELEELEKPRTDGIYVTPKVERVSGTFGLKTLGYSRSFLQFHTTGFAFYRSLVMNTNAVDEAALRGITGDFHDARYTWRMVESTAVLTNESGLTLKVKKNFVDGVLLSHPKIAIPEQFVLVETDYQLQCW